MLRNGSTSAARSGLASHFSFRVVLASMAPTLMWNWPTWKRADRRIELKRISWRGVVLLVLTSPALRLPSGTEMRSCTASRRLLRNLHAGAVSSTRTPSTSSTRDASCAMGSAPCC